MPRLATTRVVAKGQDPGSWIYFLHGIYGAGRNWASVARQLVECRPEWGCVLVDLRLHGDSRGFEPPHTVQACGEDVAALLTSTSPAPYVVLGHSFGGKVALRVAELEAVESRQVWVVDSSPAPTSPSGVAVEMLQAVRGLPLAFSARSEVVEGLQSRGFSGFVASWMATNLEKQGDVYRWRFDLDSMEALLVDFFQLDLWGIVEGPPAGLELHFVKATASAVLGEEACRRLKAAGDRTGQVSVHHLEGGHWLNADNPGGLAKLLADEIAFPI